MGRRKVAAESDNSNRKERTASVYRMVMPDHICPYGLKTVDLLKRNGFSIDDHHLRTREETTAFKEKYDVETTPDVFVVNVGDLFRRWTNDVWTSNFHRVVNPPAEVGPTTRRISIGFFHQPNYDALIECLPGCSSADRPPLYEPVTSGAFRGLRYAETDIPEAQTAT